LKGKLFQISDLKHSLGTQISDLKHSLGTQISDLKRPKDSKCPKTLETS